MLFASVVFPLFTLCPSRMGLGCLCAVGLSPSALPGRGGSRSPSPAPGWRTALPPFPTAAAPLTRRDCKPRAARGGPARPLLLLPPSHQDFSWVVLAVLPLPGVSSWRMRPEHRRGCSWRGGDHGATLPSQEGPRARKDQGPGGTRPSQGHPGHTLVLWAHPGPHGTPRSPWHTPQDAVAALAPLGAWLALPAAGSFALPGPMWQPWEEKPVIFHYPRHGEARSRHCKPGRAPRRVHTYCFRKRRGDKSPKGRERPLL